MAQTFGAAPPRIGKTTAKSVGSAGPKMSLSSAPGIRPKLGKGIANSGIKGGALKMNETGGSYGKAKVTRPVKGLLGMVK